MRGDSSTEAEEQTVRHVRGKTEVIIFPLSRVDGDKDWGGGGVWRRR